MDNVREYTLKLIDYCDQGLISWQCLAENAIYYMSEDDAKDLYRLMDLDSEIEE